MKLISNYFNIQLTFLSIFFKERKEKKASLFLHESNLRIFRF